jgi:hypothetical protein
VSEDVRFIRRAIRKPDRLVFDGITLIFSDQLKLSFGRAAVRAGLGQRLAAIRPQMAALQASPDKLEVRHGRPAIHQRIARRRIRCAHHFIIRLLHTLAWATASFSSLWGTALSFATDEPVFDWPLSFAATVECGENRW